MKIDALHFQPLMIHLPFQILVCLFTPPAFSLWFAVLTYDTAVVVERAAGGVKGVCVMTFFSRGFTGKHLVDWREWSAATRSAARM